MKREGPCYHCGIANTPLWRNGPVQKPVLCNACGSRWRIRGTLADYIPKHATKDNQDRKTSTEGETTEPNFSSIRFAEEATNKSHSSSASSSETCVQTENINDLDEFKIWDKESIPRRKRSVLRQYVLSPVERLHRDLLHIMYQQEDYMQPAEEDELMYTNTNLFSSFPETADGSMLLQSPNPETKENKRESLGTEKETKSESPLSPLTEKETKSDSPITETDITTESPCTEKKASSSADISMAQLSPKTIPPTNQVAQKNKCPLCVRKRGRPRKGTKRTICHKCTSSRGSQKESANGGKDIHIQHLAPSEIGVVSPTESRGRQLQNNQTLKGEGNSKWLNSSIDSGVCIEEEAQLFDIPLFSALDMGSEIVH